MAKIYGTPVFLSGGGGQNLTLPPMVTNLAASTGDQTITLTWTNPASDVLAGIAVVYNDDHIPEKVSDGTKVDAGLAETVDLTGLTNETLYYIRVFPYNSKKQYQTMLEGATITATPDDFPEEPTDYLECAEISETTEFIIPENGYFRIDAIAAGGTGGNAPRTGSGYGAAIASCGGGGRGGNARSEVALQKGTKILVTISSGSVTVKSNGDMEILATPGGTGGNPSSPTNAGAAGTAGGSSGGNIFNESGISGKPGNSVRTSTNSTIVYGGAGATAKVVQINQTRSFNMFGGDGRGVKNFSGSGYNPIMETSGNEARVFISRGNTNQAAPSTASVMSLTPRNASIEASWTNSGDPESVGTILVSNSDHIPVHPTDGTSVDVAEATSYTITDLPNNKPSYISLFAYNADKTKYSMAKSDVEIPREITWYDVQEDLKEDITEAQEDAEQAQKVVLLTRDFLHDAVAFTLPEIYDEWNPDSVSYIGKDTATEDNPASIVRYNDALYRCLQSHTSQASWTPEASPSLWVLIDDPAIEWPEWKQPTGAHDAYDLNAKVSHNGKKWISQIAANTTEPGADDRYWKEYTE